MDELLSVTELAAKLKIPRSSVYFQTRKKGSEAIPRVHIGKHIRFVFGEVIAWLQSQELKKRGATREG